MREDGKKMLFDPAHVTVRKGEQIRFVARAMTGLNRTSSCSRPSLKITSTRNS